MPEMHFSRSCPFSWYELKNQTKESISINLQCYHYSFLTVKTYILAYKSFFNIYFSINYGLLKWIFVDLNAYLNLHTWTVIAPEEIIDLNIKAIE